MRGFFVVFILGFSTNCGIYNYCMLKTVLQLNKCPQLYPSFAVPLLTIKSLKTIISLYFYVFCNVF